MTDSSASFDEADSLRDHFLIAMPNLVGDVFENSVTYLVEHNGDGAFGLIINKPTQLTMAEVFGDTKYPDLKSNFTPIVSGGPVQQEAVFFLHGPDTSYKNTQKISDHVSLTTSDDLLDDLGRNCGPEKLVTFLGYAGWAPGQLENEILENAWLVSPADAEIIFSTPFEEKAKKAASIMGIDLALMSGNAGHG